MEQGIVGFRFRPTHGELLNHHLKRKLQRSNYDEGRCVIPELNIYDHIPRELLAIYNEKSCKKSTSSDSYFFCPRAPHKDHPLKGGRGKLQAQKKRKAGGGYWKETSKKRCIEDEETGEFIGIKRIFSFYEGNQRNARKTELALHEYHLNVAVADETIPDLVMSSLLSSFRFPEFTILILFFFVFYMETAFALCHVKKKKQGKRASAKKQRKTASPKKQQSQLSHSLCCGDDSGSIVTPGMSEGIETQKTSLESSLVMEGLIHSDNGSSGGSKSSPEQLQICPEFQGTISNAGTTMDSQNPPTQICPGFMPFEDEWIPTAPNHDYGDGLSIEELWNWDELYQCNTLPF